MKHCFIRASLCVAMLAALCPRVRAQQSDTRTQVQVCSPCLPITDVFPVSFPAQSRAPSPDGRYVIVGVDSDSEPYHTVFLEDDVLKSRRKLFNYNRSIAVLWAEDSKSFALSDYVGSNVSQCSVISVDKHTRPIQVIDLILAALSEEAREQLKKQLSNDHVYVEAFGWTGPTDLTVKISGHGDANPSGFEVYYTVQVNPE